MHLRVYIHGHKLLALLDSGSTHNFINVGVMRRIGLQMGDSNLRVAVANGNRVPCSGVARNVAVHIGKEDFSISCIGIGFDLVLDVDYLRTLGPILWDFDDLCMSFQWGSQRVLWKGIDPPAMTFWSWHFERCPLTTSNPCWTAYSSSTGRFLKSLVGSSSVPLRPPGLLIARHVNGGCSSVQLPTALEGRA